MANNKVNLAENKFLAEWKPWGCSSVGRAVALQAKGREFDSPQLHHT